MTFPVDPAATQPRNLAPRLDPNAPTGRCPEHGDALAREEGGPDKPTLFGRTYCPTCQQEFIAALDSTPEV